MADYLNALVEIISSNVKILNNAYTKDGRKFPSLDEPFEATPSAEAVQEATRLIVAATTQLATSVRSPLEVLLEQATGMYNTVTLRFVNDHNVADLLKEAGPKGLDAKEIGKQIGANLIVLARCLRYLATRHIFREVSPNAFANNRLSSVLVKSKPFKDIETDLMTKYDDAPSSALVSHSYVHSVPVASTSAYQSFVEFMKHSKGYASPFSMTIQQHTNMFDWYEQPGQKWRAHRFATAMKAPASLWGQGGFASVFDWNALPAGSTIVDVGASLGVVTMEIARAAPQHKYIMHDLEGAVKEARRHWTNEWPEAINDGTVTLEVHSFFEPMPVKADVYFLRCIIHDWPEADCRKILGHIHAAAKSTSKLILFEMMALHACPDEQSGNAGAPYPLLANLGVAAGGFITIADMQMLFLLDGRERTTGEYAELGRLTGWKLESVKPGPIAAFIFSKVA
ncbi:hypothetical protein PLEOSDRAFT_27563 [Pleurotus ostreatus PC15]|uniref:Uncharacterized protein n=1 Tax=Pleurotus ostreatus (strain PC15) TaxID=1137138 RepID=A0A067NRW1_PLEO1|nr:hypothetical protein PLEOSDRAFT_27563 [Pleurotus ostreatus PC15]